MKRFYVLFTVLIVLALALGACTPAAPEAPMEEAAPEEAAPVEEAAPAEEEPAEEEPVEEAPAEPMEMPMIVLVPAGRVGTEGSCSFQARDTSRL